MQMLTGKKGQLENIVVVLVVVFFLAVSLIITIFVNEQFTKVVQNTALNDTTVAPDIISSMTLISTTVVDRMFLFIFGAMALAMILSAFFARNHPVWFFIYWIVTAICVVVAAPLANLYQRLIETDSFSASLASQQGVINYVMQHFIAIIIVLAVICTIIALSKPEDVYSGGTQDI